MAQGTLDEFGTENTEPDLTVDPTGFLGADPTQIYPPNRRKWGVEPSGEVYRFSYHYFAEYPINRTGDQSRVGVIELRARIWLTNTDLPREVRKALERAAHRAAYVFDTSIETGAYAGYLTGFNAGDGNLVARSDWEGPEAIGGPNSQVGKVDWNVEIYDEDGDLRGIAQGLANIWRLMKGTIPGEEAVHTTPHKWRITKRSADDRYQISPPGRSDAMARYKPGGAGAGKVVKINGATIGSLGQRGRVFVTDEYWHGNPTHGDQHSRQGVIETTEATPQAFRDGGVLYLTGETMNEVHLSTAKAKPPGYRAADPSDVSPDLDVRPGAEPKTVLQLEPRTEPDAPTPIHGKRDEKVTNALGRSAPPWSHDVAGEWWA